MLKNRFETAALLTVAQQRNSKTYYDGLIAWAIEVVSLSASYCLVSSVISSAISKDTPFINQIFCHCNTQLGSGKYGDALRVLAGGGRAANQIEYTTRYGSASVPSSIAGVTTSTGTSEPGASADLLSTEGNVEQLGLPRSSVDIASPQQEINENLMHQQRSAEDIATGFRDN